MSIHKNLQEIINRLKSNEEYKENIVHWQTIEAKEAKLVDFPESIHPHLKKQCKNEAFMHCIPIKEKLLI